MPSKTKTIREAFDECQSTTVVHAKLLTSLKKTYEQSEDRNAFQQEFLQHIKHAMVVFKREPAVERILEFAAKFATSVDDEPAACSADEENTEISRVSTDRLLPFVFNFMLKSHGARDRAVRFRACQMINKLLNSMGEDADIDDDLYNGIYDSMLVRLRDIIPVVRVQAVLALARLQAPEDASCPVIAAYIYLLEGDLSYEVRRAVLFSIAPSAKTLPSILATTRDVKEIIRKCAYQVLSEKVHIRALTIAQRVKLLKDGLSDRSEAVREACATKLLQRWLRIFDGNVLDLLKCLDVENSTDDTAELALKVVFNKVAPAELVDNFDLLNDNHVITAKDLTCEGALYWHHLCAFLKTQGTAGEVLLDNMTPTVSDFCEYLQSFVKTLKSDVVDEEEVEETLKRAFIAKQLLHIANLLDLSDEVGRKRLENTVHDMLVASYIPSTLVKLLVDLFNRIHGDDEERITIMAEIIADVREPITQVEVEISDDEKRKKELKIASIRVELNETRDNLEDLVAKQDFEKAAALKSRLEELEMSKASLLEQSNISMMEKREEKNDPDTLVKCLTIASEVMKYLSVNRFSPILQTLIDTLVSPGILNQDPAVRNLAVECIGLASLLNRTFACQQLLLLMQISQVDQETIKVTALQAIFDLLHLYGLEAFKVDASGDDESNDDEDESGEEKKEEQSAASSVVTILSGLLDSESSEIRTVAAEGMAKLLLAGRVSSPKLLRRLLILWYNPTTEEDLHLRHCLGAFLPAFASAGRSQQECFEQAFLPTLQTLFEAPDTSPLASINENNVAEFLVHLTDHRYLSAKPAGDSQDTVVEDSTVHDNLSLILCNEILEDPYGVGVRCLCKILNMLALSHSNQTQMKDLSVLVDRMMTLVEEKVIKRQLEKFQQMVERALSSAASGDAAVDNAAVDSQEELSQDDGSVSQEDDGSQKHDDKGAQKENGVLDSQEPSQDEDVAVSQDVEKEDKASSKPTTPENVNKEKAVVTEKKTAKRKTKSKKTTKVQEEEQEETVEDRLAPPQRSTRKTRGAAKSVSEPKQKKNPETFKTPAAVSTAPAGRRTRGTKASKKAITGSVTEDIENDCLESPDTVVVPVKRNVRKTKVNLAQLLSDSESDVENIGTAPATKNRSTRATRRGGRTLRILADLSNTDDEDF